MNSMPNEILLEIFSYLSASELIALSTMCRAFNRIISDSVLVKKLLLNFRQSTKDESSIGNRRYTRLNIGSFTPTLHLTILRDTPIGGDLVSINLRNHKFKLESIRKILNETPNVKELSFNRIKLSDVPKVIRQPLPQLKNVDLISTESDSRIYRVLCDCGFEKITISQRFDDGFYRFSEFHRLLKSQTTLKHLSFNGLYKTSLFTDDSLDKVDFHLESFSVTDSIFLRTVHLKTFLEAHSKTLRTMKISKITLCDFSTVLNKLNALTSLSLATVELGYLETLAKVEELSIEGHKIKDTVLEKLPNVKRLKLLRVDRKSLLNSVSKYMKDLEFAEIAESSINGLAAPTIKNLSLQSVHCPPNFFEVHFNIEHLSIDHCSGVTDETVGEIVKFLRNLKSLTIICADITEESLFEIRDSCASLEILRIEALEDTEKSLDWRILESRKEIKVYFS